jgi:glycosyltransferase involved in cell wall biosynthesis
MAEVTVLMSVHNGEDYLREAVESILRQDRTDFEFLILNNGSTDSSPAILEEYASRDERIRVIHQEDLGFVASLNKGLKHARGDYIARMDADDDSLPRRLTLQSAELDRHSEAVLVTGGIDLISADSSHLKTHYTPLEDRDLRRSLWNGNPLYHTSVMFRRDAVLSIGGYQTGDGPIPIEDYDLYLRLAELGEFRAVPAIVLRYRVHPDSMSLNNKQLQTDLIAELATERWASSRPSVAGTGELRRRLRDYGSVESPSRPLHYRRGLQDQLIKDNIDLGMEFIRRRSPLSGLRQILNVTLSGWRGASAVCSRFLRAIARRLRTS